MEDAAPRQSPSKEDDTAADPSSAGAGDDDAHAAKRARFRFKSKHSSKSRQGSSRHGHNEDEHSTSSREHHRRHHRHKRPRTPTPSPDEEEPPDPYQQRRLDPDAAFRESLFDAMADDEGAAYWETVYGQPVHVYASQRERVNDQGELERMTDDEYAAYVRQKMWEKTHAGLLEERARRQKDKEARERKAEEDRRIHAEMERSLRRGQERKRRRLWKDRWGEYLDSWARWDGALEGIPWPAESRQRRDIEEENVRSFFVKGLDLEGLGEKEFAAKLKEERVRWHPDKVQQRLGGQVDEAVMRDVTAIFQIIDKLWADTRSANEKT